MCSQASINQSTIINHIIENILNDNGEEEDEDDDLDTAANSTSGGGPTGVHSETTKNGTVGSATNTNTSTGECSTEQIKEKIYQSLKDDIMRRTTGGAKDSSNDLTALWKMLPNPMAGVTPKPKNGSTSNSTISALGLSNFPNAAANTATASASSKSKDTDPKAHSAPASQSGSGAPSPRGCSDVVVVSAAHDNVKQIEPSVSVTLVTAPNTSEDLPLNLVSHAIQ